MTITIYSTDNCMKCTATKRAFDRVQLAYVEVRVDLDDSARDFVKGLGYTTAPVVVTNEGHWSDFRPDRIKALAATA